MTLSLAGAPITDAGLKELAALNNLSAVHVFGTKVTNEGIADLKKTLPKCQVTK